MNMVYDILIAPKHDDQKQAAVDAAKDNVEGNSPKDVCKSAALKFRPVRHGTHQFGGRNLPDSIAVGTRAQPELNDHTMPGHRQRQLSLAPVVGAALVDPFNSWPVAWRRDLDKNFQFLLNSFGPSMFGYQPNDQGFEIFQTQAQLALQDPAAFHSLMIISTIREGQVAGNSIPGMNSMWHRIEALRLIKERIDSGDMKQCTSEGSIYAVMCLMGIGAQWNAVDQDEFDSSALNRLIYHKGGLQVISQAHPILEMSLFGMAVLNPGLLRSDLFTVSELSAIDQQRQDSKTLLYSLLGFLRGISRIDQKLPLALARTQFFFASGTPSYFLLTYTPNHPGILNDRQQMLQKRLRQHVVLYVFTILLWADPPQVEEFIQHLNFILLHSNIWRNSLRLFAWALIANVRKGSLMFPAQAWQSYEILCALHCLDSVTQSNVLEYCLGLLVGARQSMESVNELMASIRSVMFSPQTVAEKTT